MSASRYQPIAAQASAFGCRHFRDVPLSASNLSRISIEGNRVTAEAGAWIPRLAIKRGRATSRDVTSLIWLVREKVEATTGVVLNCEVRYVDERCRLTAMPKGE